MVTLKKKRKKEDKVYARADWSRCVEKKKRKNREQKWEREKERETIVW